jgi:AcrR family transcriptional regulator
MRLRRRRIAGRSIAGDPPPDAAVEPRSRPGGRSARVREAVLQAAFSLLAEKGVEAFTIAEVAARAGVHETSIYRRWRTKDTLAIEATVQFAKSAVPVPDTGSLRSDLIVFVKRVIALLRSPQGQTMLALGQSQEPHVVAARQNLFRLRRELVRPIFDRAVARGEFPHDADPWQFLETLIAPLYLRLLVTGEPLKDWPHEELVDRLLHAFTRDVVTK